MNNVYSKLVLAGFGQPPRIAQSLGGKVSHCRIEGKIEIIENVVGSMALAVVPVEILTTA